MIKHKITRIILGILGLIILILFVWISSYYVNKPRWKSHVTPCVGNLKQIGIALHMYAGDYSGFFPPEDGAKGLELLRELGYLETLNMYQCDIVELRKKQDKYRKNLGLTFLLNEENKPKSILHLSEEFVQFHYRGGLKVTDSPDIAIAWDKENNHEKYGNILFLDKHVSGFSGANWMNNIKR